MKKTSCTFWTRPTIWLSSHNPVLDTNQWVCTSYLLVMVLPNTIIVFPLWSKTSRNKKKESIICVCKGNSYCVMHDFSLSLFYSIQLLPRRLSTPAWILGSIESHHTLIGLPPTTICPSSSTCIITIKSKIQVYICKVGSRDAGQGKLLTVPIK